MKGSCLGKADRRRSVISKPCLTGCYSYQVTILTQFCSDPHLWQPVCHSKQRKKGSEFPFLRCPLHNRFQHPLGKKSSYFLDVPAQRYSSCKNRLFVGYFILLSRKKKTKKTSARPHAAIAEQFLALIACLKLVYIFLQCTRISRTDMSFISLPLTIS